jgi:hypothetical protein
VTYGYDNADRLASATDFTGNKYSSNGMGLEQSSYTGRFELSDNVMLVVLSALNAVLRVLTPDDPIDEIIIEQRTREEVEVRVAWHAGVRFSLPLSRGEWSTVEVIYRLFGEMQDYLADSAMAFGEARPPCPGHTHPRNIVLESGAMLRWKCPTEGIGPPAFAEVLDSQEH